MKVDRVNFILEDSEASEIAIETSDDLEEFDNFDSDDSEQFDVFNIQLVYIKKIKNKISTKNQERKVTLLETEFIPPEV